MANREHLARLRRGELTLAGVDLRAADLTGVDLSWVDLRKASLIGANLRRAFGSLTDLREADLTGANLTRAHLRFANLSRVDFQGADLQEATLEDVDLQMANLSEAKLTGAKFLGPKMGGTILGNVDLSTVHGLETVAHQGPSTISTDTLHRSRGLIPDVFLRGAGVPEDIIISIRTLTGRPSEFYLCFISYSSKDEEFAKRLYTDLNNKGVSCWFSPRDIRGGRKLEEQIDQAIRLCKRLLLILSPNSMNSEWVKTEIAKARQREVQEKRRVLFPVSLVSFEAIRRWECFDADIGKDSAREIREYFIPDFSNWKNDEAYQGAFHQLLRGLQPDTIPL
jgi:TIR domain/Pentapeptide repeats (8 copies)